MLQLIKILFSFFTLTNSQTLIGSQRDDHGCSLDGGYQWCETTQSCIRPWMTECHPVLKDPLPMNCHKDSYNNCVPNNCRLWFDGCNRCMVSETGLLGCTRMYCIKPDVGKCLDSHKINLDLKENDICYRFCEDGSEPNVQLNSQCPHDTTCKSPSNSMVSFDSCGVRAHRCLKNPH